MNPLLLGTLFDFGGKLLDRIFPDPEQKAAAVLELEKLRHSGELATLAATTDLAKGQQAINLKEAEHASVFVAGWRPFIGWSCGIGLCWNFLGHPLAMWIAAVWHPDFIPPSLVGDNLMELTLAMLGMAGLRSWEKKQDIARDAI